MKIKYKLNKSVILGAFLTVLTGVSHASTIMVEANGIGNQFEINFEPFVLTVTGTNVADNDLDHLIFSDFFTTGSTADGSAVSGTIDITIDGVTTSHATNSSTGTFNSTNGGLNPNVLFINTAGAGLDDLATGTEIEVSTTGIIFSSANVPDIAEGPISVGYYGNVGRPLFTSLATVSVPEPSSGILGIIGLSAMALRRRR